MRELFPFLGWKQPGAGTPKKTGPEGVTQRTKGSQGRWKRCEDYPEGRKIQNHHRTVLTKQNKALSLQLCISWLAGGEWSPPAAGLCLAAPVPRKCCHGWAQQSCTKGAWLSWSLLLVSTSSGVCSMLGTEWWHGQCGLCIDTVLLIQD